VVDDKSLCGFRKAGFRVYAKDSQVKLVLGRCEVHLSKISPDSRISDMEIPVVRIDRQGELPKRVTDYLSDRNERGGGPGLFEIEGNMIWYRAVLGPEDSPEDVAAQACHAVEKIGPKILNLLK
jgi:hypothetical protein